MDVIELGSCFKFQRAGPNKQVVFKAEETRAAIVTCGGLCPGLNVVVKSITNSLINEYKVKEVYGIKWGYKGFYEDFPKHWIELNNKVVANIQNIGGTMLGSSRGGFDTDKMIEALQKKQIN